MNRFLPLSLFLLFLTPANSDAAELARLFFSPEQRTALELTQSKQTVTNIPALAASAPIVPTQPARIPPNITVNGIIQRSDGNRIVWINGQAQAIPTAPNGNPASVTLPNQTQRIELKVGQRWRPNSSTP
jgi:hypothetical protein